MHLRMRIQSQLRGKGLRVLQDQLLLLKFPKINFA